MIHYYDIEPMTVRVTYVKEDKICGALQKGACKEMSFYK